MWIACWMGIWTRSSTRILCTGRRARRLRTRKTKSKSRDMQARLVKAGFGSEFKMTLTVAQAAVKIRAGDVVAFPTETVYGLGANALDENAVAKIFAMKGRPATSPLIVHVASEEMAREVAAEWTPLAHELAGRWWGGPLQRVLHQRPAIGDLGVAGLYK